MSYVTDNISRYVKKKGFNLSKMSRETGVSYQALYYSLINDERDRDLRDYELLSVCAFLGVDPMDFAEQKQEGG